MKKEKSESYLQLYDIIEELTTSGTKILDKEFLRQLKEMCKKSHDNVTDAFNIVMEQLEKDHAEIRYSSFQVMNELFTRSHLFRKLTLVRLHDIFCFTMETQPKENPLPLPKNVGKELKSFAVKTFYEWYKKYYTAYHKLFLGYEFLKYRCNINFDSIDILTREDEVRKKKKLEDEERIRLNKLEQVDIQYNYQYNDIVSNIKETENCFELLIPKNKTNETKIEGDRQNSYGKSKVHDTSDNGFSISSGEAGAQSPKKEEDFPDVEGEMHLIGSDTGILNDKYEVTIEFDAKPKVIETAENKNIIESLHDLYKEVCKHHVTVKRWLNILTKCSCKDLKKLEDFLNLKNNLANIIEKYVDIEFVTYDDEESDNFVEVPEKKVFDEQQPGCSKGTTCQQTLTALSLQ